jgi:uncharacterized protein YbjQ (UPF0145 family)
MSGPWGSGGGGSEDAVNTGGVILTTTPTIEGRPVKAYLGIVTGEVIRGANIFRDLLAGITDIVGGRSGAYETVLQEGRAQALAEVSAQAERLGADAVVNIRFFYETLGQSDSMLMVAASGTAVKFG